VVALIALSVRSGAPLRGAGAEAGGSSGGDRHAQGPAAPRGGVALV